MQYRAELDYVVRNVDCIVDIKHDQMAFIYACALR